MGTRDFKDRLYQQFARVGLALASPRRLELLDLLAQGERSVEELSQETEQSIGNTSQHLKVLREAQLVRTDKRGLRVFYRLADSNVLQLWQTLRSVGETQLAEIDRLIDEFLGYRDDLDAIGKEELLRRMEEGTVVVVDTRPFIEYRQGHIAGALSIPVEELASRLEEIPEDRDIVAYCRGPYCVYADQAVQRLQSRGRVAAKLKDGYPEWATAGLPVAMGEVAS
ncbi:MAG: metalloregulator ArsR/SmtB family transcription factor [Chloroflexota bacterium]